MARQDTVCAWYNVPQTQTTTANTALLVPTASGVYPGLPSPNFPLSTTTFPDALSLGVPPDIAGGEFDGHVFEVLLALKVTTSATANFTVNLYNVTAAAVAGGPSASTYTAAALTGTGVTTLLTGTATAVGTGGASVNIVVRAQFIWDSVSKILGIANTATTFQKGVSITTTATNATVASLGASDLNFLPSFTVSAGTATILVTEFSINRI